MLTKQLKVLIETSLENGKDFDAIREILKLQGFSDNDITEMFDAYRSGDGKAHGSFIKEQLTSQKAAPAQAPDFVPQQTAHTTPPAASVAQSTPQMASAPQPDVQPPQAGVVTSQADLASEVDIEFDAETQDRIKTAPETHAGLQQVIPRKEEAETIDVDADFNEAQVSVTPQNIPTPSVAPPVQAAPVASATPAASKELRHEVPADFMPDGVPLQTPAANVTRPVTPAGAPSGAPAAPMTTSIYGEAFTSAEAQRQAGQGGNAAASAQSTRSVAGSQDAPAAQQTIPAMRTMPQNPDMVAPEAAMAQTPPPPVRRPTAPPTASINVGIRSMPELQQAQQAEYELQQKNSIVPYVLTIVVLLAMIGGFFYWFLQIREGGTVDDLPQVDEETGRIITPETQQQPVRQQTQQQVPSQQAVPTQQTSSPSAQQGTTEPQTVDPASINPFTGQQFQEE